MKSTNQLTVRHKIAKRYALAFFDLAQEKKYIDRVYQDILTLLENIDLSPELNNFLQSSSLTFEKSQSLLETLFKNHIDALTLQFLYFLAGHDRLDILKEISLEFEKLYFEYKEIVKVKITSARELKKEQSEAIAQRLKSRFSKDIHYEVEIDPGLIGGFKVQAGDVIYDFSVRNQLDKFKKQILAAKE